MITHIESSPSVLGLESNWKIVRERVHNISAIREPTGSALGEVQDVASHSINLLACTVGDDQVAFDNELDLKVGVG